MNVFAVARYDSREIASKSTLIDCATPSAQWTARLLLFMIFGILYDSLPAQHPFRLLSRRFLARYKKKRERGRWRFSVFAHKEYYFKERLPVRKESNFTRERTYPEITFAS